MLVPSQIRLVSGHGWAGFRNDEEMHLGTRDAKGAITNIC
jgi:hypothetical protein